MKRKYSDLVSGMSGKLNGSVSARGRFGDVVRNKVTPRNRKTSSQLQVRAGLSTFSKMWGSDLTDAQRLGFIAWADVHKGSNIFGDSFVMTGLNVFVKMNQLRKLAGQTTISDCPTEEMAQAAFISVGNTTIDISSAELTVDLSPNPATGNFFVVEATAPVSPGVLNVNNKYRVIGVIAGTGADLDPSALYTKYTAKFGVPAENKKVFVRVKNFTSTYPVPRSCGSDSCIVSA